MQQSYGLSRWFPFASLRSLLIHTFAGGKVVTIILASSMTNASRTYPLKTKRIGLNPPILHVLAINVFSRGIRMNLYTVRFFAKAIKYGSKYVYQTVPRLLTIWLDLGDNRNLSSSETFKKLNDTAAKAIKEAPVYKVRLSFMTRPYRTDVLSVVYSFSSNRVPRGPHEPGSL
jgi:hypothetical protein